MRRSFIHLAGLIVLWTATYCLLISLAISGVIDVYKSIWLLLYTTVLIILPRYLTSFSIYSKQNTDQSQTSNSNTVVKEVPRPRPKFYCLTGNFASQQPSELFHVRIMNMKFSWNMIPLRTADNPRR